MSIKRKAILIGAPGKGKGYLEGVKEDIRTFRNFLLSPAGGNWYEGEIHVIWNPEAYGFVDKVSRLKAHYTITLFVGHGYTRYGEGRSRLVVNPEQSIPDIRLFNQSQRQLVVLDSCRDFVLNSGLAEIGGLWENFDGQGNINTRKYYDNWIRRSLPGRVIVHGTQNGYSAGDTPFGGLYTQALLNYASNLPASSHKIQLGGISTLNNILRNDMIQQGGDQIPEITYGSGNLDLPFSLHFPERVLR